MLSPLWKDIISVGFLGAFTTFSTFSLDIFRLLQSNQMVEAMAYIVSSVLFCLLGTWLGYNGIKFILTA